MSEWKYQIGDVLTCRANLVEPVPRDPDRLFVVERMVQECPGGVQRHYVCRVTQEGSGGDRVIVNEVEVAPFAEWVALRPRKTVAGSVEELVRQLEAAGVDVREIVPKRHESEESKS